jgi:hypothetical protein
MDSLNYTTYEKNVVVDFKGNNQTNKTDLALANRPLIPILPDWNNNKKQNTKPSSHEDLHKSSSLKYNEKDSNILPITIKPGNNNNYVVLENELINSDIMETKSNDKMITNIPVINNKEKPEKTEHKMNFATQLYMGSLTVIGLFVFYRLIQKTR